MVSCLELFMQEIICALILARLKAGNSMAARIAIMAITTSSSISVNPPLVKGEAKWRPMNAGGLVGEATEGLC